MSEVENEDNSDGKFLKDIKLSSIVFYLFTLAVVAYFFSMYQIQSIVSDFDKITMQGISIFAVLYIITQLVERITEVAFSNHFWTEDADTIDDNSIKIENIKIRIKAKIKKDPEVDISELEKDIGTYSKAKDEAATRRALGLWWVASLLGTIFTSLTIGMVWMIGMKSFPHEWDSFISGIIIGGGAKPLHDLISYIEAKKE